MVMETPPPSRYRIVEKDGRLIVYDRGVLVSTKSEKPSGARTSGPMAVADGVPWFDRIGTILVRLMTTKDASGRVLMTRKVTKGFTQVKQTAVVSVDQAVQLGRGLALLLPLVSTIVLSIVTSGAALPLLVVTVPVAIGSLVVFAPLMMSLKWDEA